MTESPTRMCFHFSVIVLYSEYLTLSYESHKTTPVSPAYLARLARTPGRRKI